MLSYPRPNNDQKKVVKSDQGLVFSKVKKSWLFRNLIVEKIVDNKVFLRRISFNILSEYPRKKNCC